MLSITRDLHRNFYSDNFTTLTTIIILDVVTKLILDLAICSEHSIIGNSIFLRHVWLFGHKRVSINEIGIVTIIAFAYSLHTSTEIISSIVSFLRKYDGDMLGVFSELLMSPMFWFLTLFIIIICLIPSYLFFTYRTYRPLKILRRNEEFPHMINCDDNSERSSLQAMVTQIQ